MRILLIITYSLLITSFLGCTARKELGTIENPIKIALVPGKDTRILEENGKKMQEWLNQNSKYKYAVFVPPSFVATLEAIGSKRADLAVMNTLGYLKAHEKYQAKIIFTLTTQGRSHYRGQIIARVDGPKTLKDLNGKKFAYVDPLSASGYLMAAAHLKKNNIHPSETVYAGRHDNVVTMVYQKQVAAGATFYAPDENGEARDARALVKTQLPDVFKKIKILEMTDELPNEGFVIRKELPVEVEESLKASLTELIKSEQGRETLKALYNADGLKLATDIDYDGARHLLKSLDKDLSTL